MILDSMIKYLKVALYVSDSRFRDSLVSSLSDSNSLAVIDSQESFSICSTGETASPNVVVVHMGGDVQESASTVTAIKKHFSDSQVLAIVEEDDFDQVMVLLKAGATGVISRDNMGHLHAAIEDLLGGGAPLPRRSARKLIESFQRNVHSPLTSRETDVMIAMSQGKSYKMIAQDLYVHPETVKTHMKNIYCKLSVRSKAEAIEVAKRDRLI